MDMQKLLIGVILGYVGYMAYKKLQGSQTVVVSDLSTVTGVPDVLSITDFASMAGRRK